MTDISTTLPVITNIPDNYQSPFLQALFHDISMNPQFSSSQFWSEIQRRGTPIIESCPTRPKEMFVTFIVQGDADTVNLLLVNSFFNSPNPVQGNLCNRIQGTDIFYKVYLIPRNIRTIYAFSRNNPLDWKYSFENLINNWQTFFSDPHNLRKIYERYRWGNSSFTMEYSILELPDAKPERWLKTLDQKLQGNLQKIELFSNILQMRRHFWVYTPPGYSSQGDRFKYGIIFDGKAYLDNIDTEFILENLITAGIIPPMLFVFIHNYGAWQRPKDLNCYPPFNAFIAEELVPWLENHYYISSNPRDVVLIGSSSGGLAASHIAVIYPSKFANVLSMSGYYEFSPGMNWYRSNTEKFGSDFVHWWTDEDEKTKYWFVNWMSKKDRVPVKFYLNIGMYELNDLPIVRSLQKILESKGYTVKYEEYPGGHEYISWRNYLEDGLKYLFSPENSK